MYNLRISMRFNFQPSDGIHLNLLATHWLKPASWNHPNLQAPYWRLYWNEGPGMALHYKGSEIPLLPDHFVLIAPETPFAAHTEHEAMHFYVHFLTSPVWRKSGVEILRATPAQRRFLSALVQSVPKTTNRWKITALVADCLEELPPAHWIVEKPFGKRVQAAIEMIEGRLPQRIAVGDIAQHVGMNLNAFIRLFREQTRQTPAAFMLERRLATACLFLHHTEQNIERIAEDCGFCDRHHFTRAFSKCRGTSPAAFRQQSRIVRDM